MLLLLILLEGIPVFAVGQAGGSVLPSAAGSRPARASGFDELLQQGFALHRQGQFEAAIPLLRQAQRMRPQDYFANLLLGIDELRTGHPEQAVTLLQTAHRARSQEAMASGYLAEAWTALRQYDRAVTLLQAAARDDHDGQAALTLVEFELDRFASLAAELRSSRRGLAFAYLLQAEAQPAQQQPAALQALQHAAAIAPDLPGLAGALGQVEFSLGHWQAAAQAWAQALRRQPNDLDAWVGQAQLAAQQHDPATAQALLDRVAAHSPHRLEQALKAWPAQLGIPAATGRPASPAQMFFSCLARRGSRQACPPGWLEKSAPNRAGAFSPQQLAATRRRAEQSAHPSPASEARPQRPTGRGPHELRSWGGGAASKFGAVAPLFEQQDWERVARLRPAAHSAHAAFEIGVALAHLDRCAAAIPALETARASEALRAQADFFLSRCYAQDAGAIVATRLHGAGQDALVHEVRGDILLRLSNNGAGAVAEYREALAAASSDPALWARLAEAEQVAGHVDEAATAARQSLRIDPHRLQAMRTLAQISFDQKDYAAAAPWLQQIVTRAPDDLQSQVELGTALARQGKPGMAVSLLQHALQAGYPDERGALHFLLGTVLRQLGRAPEARQAFQQAQQLSDAFSERAQAPHDATR